MHVVAREGLAHLLVLVRTVPAVITAVAEIGVSHAEVVGTLELVLGAVSPIVEPRRAARLIRQI